MAEHRTLSVHPDIIFSLINSQAGTLGKAVLELIMNAIDAGASFVSIDIDHARFSVKDDGRGFQSRQEIEDFFETFGTPHQAGDARYGRYRMGRGQIMAFSATQWRTTTFMMDVDIKNRGLDYILDDCDMTQGCHIDGKLYAPMLPSEFSSFERELAELGRYAEIPVYLNGEQINMHPTACKWDIETDDAYISLKATGGLKVYNLGVFVREYPGFSQGTGGTIVSKKQLEVNFARNDVLVSQCEVWKRIRKFLQKETNKTLTKKPRLTEQEREAMIRRLRFGEISYDEVRSLKLITDTKGRHYPLTRFEGWKNIPCTVEPESGSQIAERVHQSKVSFVFARTMLDYFGVENGEELVETLSRLSFRELHGRKQCRIHKLVYCPFESVSQGLTGSHDILRDSELTQEEKIFLKALKKVQGNLVSLIRGCGYEPGGQRVIRIGVSDTAEAWTDGASYIALERDVLRKIKDGFKGAVYLTNLLIHEYLHREEDSGSHLHDLEFFEAFHEIVLHPTHAPSGVIARQLMLSYTNDLRSSGKRIVSAVIKDEDLLAITEQFEVAS